MDATQIQQVRRFNRLVTERVGALEDGYLRRGRPLAEARLIFEIGPAGADLRSLRTTLRLDSGYLSRLLRSLEAQHLVEVLPDAGDARQRRVGLTAAGRTEWAAYDRLSDRRVEALLAPLSTNERERLVAALDEAGRLIRASAIELSLEDAASPDARSCLGHYYAELARRFEGGFDPGSNPVGDDEMTPPAGLFVLARLDGRPVGCGGLKLRDGVTGEVKRMWVAEEARGLGIARRMLGRIEAEARERGLQAMRLDTNGALREAQAFYRREGYREVEAFNDNPYAHHWFAKPL